MKGALATIGLVLLPAGSQQATSSADDAVEYEILFHHAVRNRTDRPLDGVRVYLTIPPSDGELEVVGSLRPDPRPREAS